MTRTTQNPHEKIEVITITQPQQSIIVNDMNVTSELDAARRKEIKEDIQKLLSSKTGDVAVYHLLYMKALEKEKSGAELLNEDVEAIVNSYIKDAKDKRAGLIKDNMHISLYMLELYEKIAVQLPNPNPNSNINLSAIEAQINLELPAELESKQAFLAICQKALGTHNVALEGALKRIDAAIKLGGAAVTPYEKNLNDKLKEMKEELVDLNGNIRFSTIEDMINSQESLRMRSKERFLSICRSALSESNMSSEEVLAKIRKVIEDTTQARLDELNKGKATIERVEANIARDINVLLAEVRKGSNSNIKDSDQVQNLYVKQVLSIFAKALQSGDTSGAIWYEEDVIPQIILAKLLRSNINTENIDVGTIAFNGEAQYVENTFDYNDYIVSDRKYNIIPAFIRAQRYLQTASVKANYTILIPICWNNNHWCAGELIIEKTTANEYKLTSKYRNPLSSVNSGVQKSDRFEELISSLYQKVFNKDLAPSITAADFKHPARQNDGSSCGAVTTAMLLADLELAVETIGAIANERRGHPELRKSHYDIIEEFVNSESGFLRGHAWQGSYVLPGETEEERALYENSTNVRVDLSNRDHAPNNGPNEIINIVPNEAVNRVPNEIINIVPNEIVNIVPNEIVNIVPNEAVNRVPNRAINDIVRTPVNINPLSIDNVHSIDTSSASQAGKVVSGEDQAVSPSETAVKKNPFPNKGKDLSAPTPAPVADDPVITSTLIEPISKKAAISKSRIAKLIAIPLIIGVIGAIVGAAIALPIIALLPGYITFLSMATLGITVAAASVVALFSSTVSLAVTAKVGADDFYKQAERSGLNSNDVSYGKAIISEVRDVSETLPR